MKTKFWCFDNGGKTADRYTIVLNDEYGTILGASEHPFWGFGQFCGEILSNKGFKTVVSYIEEARKHPEFLGAEITDESLIPEQVKMFINQYAEV